MERKRILVFPCGSEIGLEVHRSLRFSRHVELIGGSSVDDHGRFVFKNYIAKIPRVTSPDLIPILKKIIEEYNIDAIYPTMDLVITTLKRNEQELNCKIISSTLKTTELCLSKEATYAKLTSVVPIPKLYRELSEVDTFPVFLKPKIGYSSRGARLISSIGEGMNHFKKFPTCIILEHLPGEEYTVDCFTDRNRQLLFVKARIRQRIKFGISVNTHYIENNEAEFHDLAVKLNNAVEFRGAWFFQLKRDSRNNLTLLEVASRLGGSSGVGRAMGFNFALMSVFDAFDVDVSPLLNNYKVELDRSLNNVFKLNIDYKCVYVDYDDCLVLDGKLNYILLNFLFQAFEKGKKIVLLSKHEGDLINELKQKRIERLFDEVIHIEKAEEKRNYIKETNAIFIDDSYSERLNISRIGMPVFSPDMVECLIN